MRAIRLSFLQMLQCLTRDMMLFVVLFAPIPMGIMLKGVVPILEKMLTGYLRASAVLSPYYGLLDVLFIMITPTMYCFVSAMVALEEKDEGTARYLLITPVGKAGYMCSRFMIPAFCSFVVSCALLPIFGLCRHGFIEVLLLGFLGTLQGLIVAFLILCISSNKLEGMAVAKLSGLYLMGAVVPFFVEAGFQYVLSPLPSYWMGKAACEGNPSYTIPGLLLSALWLLGLYRRR